MATFLELYNQIALELDLDEVTTVENATAVETLRLCNQINRAYKRIWNRLKPINEDAETKASLSITGGTNEYSIPTTIKQVQMVKLNADDPPLRIVPWTELELKYTPTLIADVGSPGVCGIYQRKIKFWPAPDEGGTATIWGLGGFTALSNDDDEPALDDDLHDVVFDWALLFAMGYEGNPATELQIMNAKEALKEARAQMRRHHQEPPRMIHEDEFDRGDTWIRSM